MAIILAIIREASDGHLQRRRGEKSSARSDRQGDRWRGGVITRHGKPVAELRPSGQRNAKPSGPSRAMLQWLLARTRARKSVGITSVELLNQMYEEEKM